MGCVEAVIERGTVPDGSALEMMWWINKSVRLILMGKLVPYLVTFHMRNNFMTIERILYPC